MPYALATFDADTDGAMRATVKELAENSAFMPTTDPFHVPLLGSLHHYSTEQVAAALAKARPHAVTASFHEWQLTKSGGLRVLVKLHRAAPLVKRLRAQLPRSREWKVAYVYLGSAANIDESCRADFLNAVKTAFPIDPKLVYSLEKLDYNAFNVDPKLRKNSRKTKDEAVPRRSPHRKWASEQASGAARRIAAVGSKARAAVVARLRGLAA